MEQHDSDKMNSRVHHIEELDQGNNKRQKLSNDEPDSGERQDNDDDNNEMADLEQEASGESQEQNEGNEESSEKEGEDESDNQQEEGSGYEDDDDGSQFSEDDEEDDGDENSFSYIQDNLPEWQEDVLGFGVARRLNEMLISTPGDLTRIRAVIQEHSPAILNPLYHLNYEKRRQMDHDADSYILSGEEYVNGWPVHISLESSAPMPVILYLLQLFPQQAHLEKRRPSLHWACRGVRNRMEMIEFFYERAPESISQRDSQGKLPLHHFLWDCYGDSSFDIFEFLISKYPRAIRTRDRFGRYPLHYACDNDDITLEMVKILVADFPRALTVPDESGYLPLHNMCRRTEKVGAPPECAEVLDFIMTQYPEALKHASNCGQLPLHIASEEGVSIEGLKKMVRLYPQAMITLVQEKEYTLPIQLAYSCTDDVPDEEEWLQEAIPILTPPSCSPMLFCCNQGCSLDLIKYIQEKLDPDSCTRFHPLVTNAGVEFGALPLHIACMSGNPELNVLKWLVKNNPTAVSFKMQGLFYPLQCFFKSKRPASEINFEALEYIVDQYPAVIKERDYKGMLPIQVAVASGASLSVIYHLLRMAPDDMANVFKHPTSVAAAASAKKKKKESAMIRGAAVENKTVANAAGDKNPASIIDNGNMSSNKSDITKCKDK